MNRRLWWSAATISAALVRGHTRLEALEALRFIIEQDFQDTMERMDGWKPDSAVSAYRDWWADMVEEATDEVA